MMSSKLLEVERDIEGRTYVLTYERVMQPYGVAQFIRFQKINEDGELVDADNTDIRDSYAFGMLWNDIPNPKMND
jgi:hypothetical protein